MGSLKDKTLKSEQPSEDVQVHQLTDNEAQLLRSLNTALKFHTLGGEIMSQFLFYIATYRLGFPANSNLQFNFDWTDPTNNELKITVLPQSPTPST